MNIWCGSNCKGLHRQRDRTHRISLVHASEISPTVFWHHQNVTSKRDFGDELNKGQSSMASEASESSEVDVTLRRLLWMNLVVEDDRGVVIKESETERAGGVTLLRSRWAVGPPWGSEVTGCSFSLILLLHCLFLSYLPALLVPASSAAFYIFVFRLPLVTFLPPHLMFTPPPYHPFCLLSPFTLLCSVSLGF